VVHTQACLARCFVPSCCMRRRAALLLVEGSARCWLVRCCEPVREVPGLVGRGRQELAHASGRTGPEDGAPHGRSWRAGTSVARCNSAAVVQCSAVWCGCGASGQQRKSCKQGKRGPVSGSGFASLHVSRWKYGFRCNLTWRGMRGMSVVACAWTGFRRAVRLEQRGGLRVEQRASNSAQRQGQVDWPTMAHAIAVDAPSPC
jgi:hypothetical protein